ncbi:uncharacterized protein LOC135815232 [Sycon ciliatum]|uniref:uncharacterized protein LOC135815232 n=1 Tax=Sycon ciliatum TaxID=27933 RepID=UPI0031F657ED
MDGTEQQHADVSLGRPLSGPNRLRTPRNSIDFIAFNQAQGIGGGREDSGGRSPGLQPSNGGMARHTVMQRQHARPQQGHGRGTDYQVAVNLPNGDKAKLFGRAGMSVESLIQPLVQDLQWKEYRVVLSATRTQVNREESSAVLDGKDIDIEDTAAMRKKAGEEILESEKIYFNSLNLVIDTYAEPLKKWKLHKVSQDTLFSGIYGLRKLSENLIEELEDALERWHEEKTCVGCILNRQPNFPGVFEDYSYSYTKAARLLREKRSSQHDNGFTAFISAQRGSAVHSLDSLLLVPNQRIQTYGKLLSDLMYATPDAHHDRVELQKVTNAVSQLLDRRTEALSNAENQAKLEYMQARFTQQLHLNRPIDYVFQPTKRKKNTSSSNITSPTPDFLVSCGDVQLTDSRPNSKGLSKQEPNLANRRYIQEGPVQLTMISKSATKDRYLFLLSDVIFSAKRKATATTSSNSFHMKDRQRIRDVWIAQCPEDLQTELSDFGLEPHCSFLMGWPLANYVATFSTPQEKEMWFCLLKTQIEEPCEESQRQTVPICILNKATGNSTAYVPKKIIEVSTAHTIRDVMNMALEIWKIEDDITRYCMSVHSGKEENSFPLFGHERPYSIKLFMNTRRLDSNSVNEDTRLQQTAPFQFVLRTCQSRVPYFSGEKQQPRSRRARNRGIGRSVSSTLVHLILPRNRGRENPTINDEEEDVPPTFGQPLERVFSPDIPSWLQIALVRLYMDGPDTNGILRRSASARQVRELREDIDRGLEPDIAGSPVLCIGALIKEFLRSVPGYILNGDLYTEWVACLDPSGDAAKVKQVRRMLERLPMANQLLLHNFFVILAKIAENHAVNQMHSENVAICVSPSLLSPADDMQVLKNEVPPLIQFIVQNIDEIFDGYDTPVVVKAANDIKERTKLEGLEEGLESPEFSPDHQQHAVSDPNLRSTLLSSSNDELADDEPAPSGMAMNHSTSRMFSSSTPLLFNDDTHTPTTHLAAHSMGESSDVTNGGESLSSISAVSGIAGDSSMALSSSPQLPRSTAHIPPGPGQVARANAAVWRAGSVDTAVSTNSPAGSRLVVYRHRQAQQRALEAQQAAPGGGSMADTASSGSQRTKLHSSASMFVDQLAMGRSPGMPHRNATAADLDAEAAAGTRSLQELYEIYSVRSHGKNQDRKRSSVSLPPTGFHSASLPTTPSHSSKMSSTTSRLTREVDQTQSERIRRSMGRHWYSLDNPELDNENKQAQPPAQSTQPAQSAASADQSMSQYASSPPQRPAARVAANDDALYTVLHERLGLTKASTAAAAGNAAASQSDNSPASARRPTIRVQQTATQRYDDSSSDSGSDDSDEGPAATAFLSPNEKFLAQQQTRSLGKARGAAAVSRTVDGQVSATLYTRRSSVSTVPARVTTKAFELPMPRQPVFEDVKFDEESYV